MKKTFYQLLLPLLLLTSWAARGQTRTELQKESFENALGSAASQVDRTGTNTHVLVPSVATATTGTATATTGSTDQYFLRTSNATVATDAPGFTSSTLPTNVDGTYYWAGEGVKGADNNVVIPPTRIGGRVTLKSVSIAGYADLKVTVALLIGRSARTYDRMEQDDTLQVQVRFNGAGSWTTVGMLVGDRTSGTTNDIYASGNWRVDAAKNGVSADDVAAGTPIVGNPFSDFTFDVPGSGSTMQTRIVVAEQGGSEEFAFDNIRVSGLLSTNQAPVLGNIEGTALAYAESNPTLSVPITSSLTVSDADNTTLAGATVRFTSGFNSIEDNLDFVNQNGITGSYNTGTGVLTLSGTATLAAYQAALRSIKYRNSDPIDAQAGTRTVSFAVTDGISASLTVTRDIAVTSALDAASGLPYTEDLTTDGEGLRYTSNHFASTNGTGTAFFRTNVTTNANGQFNQNGFTAPTFSNISNGYYWYGAGVSNSGVTGYFITKQVNAASYANLQFQVRLGATSGVWDANDQTRFYYRVNNGTWVLFGSFRSTDQSANTNASGNMAQDVNPANLASPPTGTVLSPALQNFTFALPSALNGQLVDFKIEENNDSGSGAGEVFAFDLIQVSGTLLTPPTVTTAAATSITSTSAVLGGSVTADGGDAVTGRGVVYSPTNTTPAIAGTGVTQDANGTGTGTFSKTISALTPGTTYYVRAYATNSAGTSYGAVQSFTTTAVAPTVTTDAATSIATTSAVLGGSVTADGGAAVSERGVVYSTTNTTPTTSDTKDTNGTGTGTFSETITGLTSRTTYYVRAYAINSVGTSYGAVQTFTTLNIAPVVTTTGGNTTFIIGGGAVAIDNGLTVTDADNATLASATVSITSGLQSGQDVLQFSNTNTTTFGNIGSAASANGTLPLSSPGATATVAQWQAALRAVAFNNSVGTAPTTTRTVSFVVNDGTSASAPATKNVVFAAPTTVVSVTRLTPSPTATAQVRYQVVFSRSVSGVTVSNFNITNTGSVSGTNVSSVVGSGTTYTVTVNTGTGDGTLRLNVNNSTGITPTVSGLPYTGGEVYTITKSFAAAPTLRIQATGSASGNSDVTAFVDVVQVLQSGTSTVVANGLQNGSFESNNVPANGFLYQQDGVVASPWTFTTQAGVSRNNSGFGSTAASGDAVALLQSSGGTNGSVSQNLAVPTGSYQVNFQTMQRNYTSLDQRLNVFVNDVFVGNIQPNSIPTYDTFTSATFNVTAPALTATLTSATAANGGSTSTSPIAYTVTFSQAVTGFVSGDVSVSNGTVSGFNGSGTTYTFNVTPAANGAVTVNVPANSAVDANNTGNTAATTYTITYTQPATAAPVITAPANGSLTNQAAVTFSGTAPAGSTVELYVSQNGTAYQDLGASALATAAGTFSYTIPFPLPDATYSVYATAQSPGAAVSANSNINTFVVDATRPSVVITSTAGASGSTTPTTPIPFTVTFSENVTGFVAGDVTVTNGTISGFAGTSPGTVYTFNVTPTTAGTATTVSVPANVAQDAASNFNTGAPSTYSITYVQPVTAAPVVNAPANGSLINTSTPAYSGTAVANSTVTVYVDGTSIGTTTATAGGTFSLNQPTALAQGSHTVRATAQTSGSAVSANSDTNTFSVDSVQPTVAISSSTAANNGTSGSATFAYTVTFSEAVTGFVAGDVTVTNGSISGFSGSGTTYAFNVTPAANGAVTVNVPANVAVDAAGNGNTAATQYSITYSQPVTAAPVVNTPANGSLINTTTPTYSGTAVAGSTVTVYVDGSAIGTTTATGGSFSLTQPTALSQGSHTVYATAQTSGSAVSANSNTNTFSVDSVQPIVVISSTAGASGSNTTTTPIPFTVTFSEAVTGFVAGDVTVTNGSISGFSGSGTTYTFNVTPTTAGTATTVTVPANVAVDAAGNGNTGAASAYSLTYQPTAVTWNGSISGDWFTAGNWTPAVVPTTAINASIPASAPNMPALTSGTASVKALTINSGAMVSQSGGTLDVRANLTNNGTYTATGGTVVLGTSTLANILGSSNTRFWNLTVDANGAQSSTSASTSVQRLFTLTGNFATNGNPLTMESNATNTALVYNNLGVITGNVTVQRYISPATNPGLGYRHYSSPVSNATVASLATASFTPVVNPNYNTSATPNSVRPFPTVYYYDQARLATSNNLLAPFDKGWTSPSALTDPLTVGKGYTVNLTANQTLAVTGPQNNGTVTQALSRTTTFPLDAGWQLLGNPFPSPLDYSLVTPADRVNLNAAIYIFASSDQYNGTYRSFVNGIGGDPILAQGQGFFARVAAGQTSGQLTLRNAHRVTSYANPVYQRGTANRPLVQLDLQGAGKADPLYVYFENGATAGVDSEFDAVKLPNSTGLNLAAWTGNDKLAINGLPLASTASVTVPLFIGLPVTGTYTLHAAQVLNFGAGEQPFLRDLQLGTLTDLSLHPDYTFTMNAANTTPRFELVFGARVLGVASAKLAAQVVVYPNPASKAVFVELPFALNRKAVTAALVDALGRVVLTQALPAGLPTYTLPLTNLATGVYSLRLQTEAGVVVKKLVVE
ncbi:MAG: hypothetical protein JWP58_1931 [Hymenobacter sp.]|nr:hypothetical protein [Hymenobacter sp.]